MKKKILPGISKLNRLHWSTCVKSRVYAKNAVHNESINDVILKR